MNEIPHAPWFISPTPKPDGLAVIENGTVEGVVIAECEWHIAEFIVKTVNGDLSHGDLCYLSRIFNATADLMQDQNVRINEWLKTKIATAATYQ